MIAPRSIDSHWQTLGLLCVFASAPNFAAGIFWDAAFTIVPNSMSLAIFTIGMFGYVWTHFLSRVYVEKKKLVVQTPLRRREFTLPDDVSVLRTHGGISLVSKRGWPNFVFSPDAYRLSPEQKSVVDQLIAADAQPIQRGTDNDGAAPHRV
jgi:hypothetical protein